MAKFLMPIHFILKNVAGHLETQVHKLNVKMLLLKAENP
jgi:hypothetical protein